MKQIEVVAAVICHEGKYFATQRGYGEFKDFWEFPGGKMEPGETQEEALKREIREELDTEISVDDFLTTVEYPYPAFHLTMHCFFCSVRSGHLELKEHEKCSLVKSGRTEQRRLVASRCGGGEGYKESLMFLLVFVPNFSSQILITTAMQISNTFSSKHSFLLHKIHQILHKIT